MIEYNRIAKPFLKWAGGKTQLISDIEEILPKDIKDRKYTYIEPFVGSGAVLFWLLEEFPNIEKAFINDINQDLINTYITIKNNPNELIHILSEYENEYHSLADDENKKKLYYYDKRNLFNSRKENIVIQSAIFIFLNRTCFNGLYRVNKKNEFNVPIGSYKRPSICDPENILAVNRVLQKVKILSGDFEKTINYATGYTLFYLDPPYKPLNKTSSFNSYSKDEFNDKEQIRLQKFCSNIDRNGYQWILSNSDVRDKDPQNNFFDELYYEFDIKRVKATRRINANPKKRGTLNELLITNITNEETFISA